MEQTITINLTYAELTDLIESAVTKAIEKKLSASDADPLFTIEQAASYLNCSEVHIWKLRRDGKIQSASSGRKVLIPKSSIDSHLNLSTKSLAT